ncbi:MAG: hypothetical protein WCK15_12865 [Pirellula sp.]
MNKTMEYSGAALVENKRVDNTKLQPKQEEYDAEHKISVAVNVHGDRLFSVIEKNPRFVLSTGDLDTLNEKLRLRLVTTAQSVRD